MGSVPESGRFAIKRKATRPYLRLLVKDKDGNAFDFTGAVSATFMMYDSDGTQILSAAATIATPVTSGILIYQWAAGDTDLAGEFRAEFDVSYGAGDTLTIPVRGNLVIQIYEDLNNA